MSSFKILRIAGESCSISSYQTNTNLLSLSPDFKAPDPITLTILISIHYPRQHSRNPNHQNCRANMDSAPPQTTNGPTSVGQLPPEALALAGRMFDAARKGDEQSVALLSQALQRGLPANLTNDKGDTLVSVTTQSNSR